MKGNSPLFSNYSKNLSNSHDSSSSSPLNGQSQPFQEEYSVYSKMLEKDIRHGVYQLDKGGYSVNPTSKSLDEMIKDNYIIGKGVTTALPYVIDTNENVIVGKRNGNGRYGLQTPHPTLIVGLDPKVKMAGMLYIKNGKIAYYDDRSGHYRPNKESMKYADKAFKKYKKFMEEK